jgi:hypothetical protein
MKVSHKIAIAGLLALAAIIYPWQAKAETIYSTCDGYIGQIEGNNIYSTAAGYIGYVDASGNWHLNIDWFIGAAY